MLTSLDANLTAAINSLAGTYSLLDHLMIAMSAYGVPLMILAAALQWFLKDNIERRRHALICAGLAFLLGQAINQFILLFVHRIRPYDAGLTHLIIEKSADWSFPSDHATASVSIAAVFAFLGFRRQAWLFGLAAAVICWSRVHVGMHYVSDVAGGAGTALVAAAIVVKIYQPDWRLNRLLVSIL